jgi:hypothetical protein
VIFQELAYLLKESEVKRLWPRKRLLTDFYNSGAASGTIRFIVDDYFDRLPRVFDEKKKRIKELSALASQTFGELLHQMTEYKESMAIGGDFVR